MDRRESGFPPRGYIKAMGKQAMGRSLPGWMKFVAVFVALQVLTYLALAQIDAAGPGIIYFYQAAAETANMKTGYSLGSGVFTATMRLDDFGAIAQLYITATGFLRYAVANFLVLALMAPLKMMSLERMWRAFRQQPPHPDGALRWYTKPNLLGKALLVELVVVLVGRFVIIAASLPGWAVSIFAYVKASATGATAALSLLSLVSMFLMVMGILVGYYLVTRLIPITYCLAAQPDYSIGKIFRRGLDSTKGYESGFFAFRLTMLPWYIISSFTAGAADLYVFPYVSFASFQYLQESAVDRQNRGQGAPIQRAPDPEE